jgi:hypothetical protein
MYLDQQTEFASAQAVTASAISQNVLDLFAASGGGTNLSQNARQDIGAGESPHLLVRTLTAATDVGNDATLTVTLEHADDAALSVNATPVWSSGPIPFASFSPAGSTLVAARLPNANYRRYLGVRFTVLNGPLTGGTFSAALVNDLQANNSYRSAYRVQ